jgi:signal transduction histidine kinase
MNVRIAAVIVCAGTALSFTLALGLSPRRAVLMTAAAIGGAVIAGAAGALVLTTLHRRSIGTQVAAVALTQIAAIATGGAAAAWTMSVTPSELHAMLAVLAAAGPAGLVLAQPLGRRVERASRSLGEVARRIGEGEYPSALPATAARELEELARALDAMSMRLEDAHARERAVEASRRELVAWVSHDLRTPLAGIRAMAEALEDGVVADAGTVRRYHTTIRREADRLTELVDGLFELSRIHAGTIALDLQRVSLADLVSDAIAAADPIAAVKGVQLEGRCTDDATAELSAPEVSRVLRNLIENAIRHTPNDGTVSVVTGVDEGRAFVSVADSCGGIPEADLGRVFDTAFRGESARTPSRNDDGLAPGAGIGLAIAQGIVEAHHGQITVRNEGVGCRFDVRLPLRQPR